MGHVALFFCFFPVSDNFLRRVREKESLSETWLSYIFLAFTSNLTRKKKKKTLSLCYVPLLFLLQQQVTRICSARMETQRHRTRRRTTLPGNVTGTAVLLFLTWIRSGNNVCSRFELIDTMDGHEWLGTQEGVWHLFFYVST